MKFRMKKFWMGPEEKIVNEGFDELFKVEEDYKIPPPSQDIKNRLTEMTEQDTKELGFTEVQGFESAMDTVFGRKNREEEERPEPMMTTSPTPTAASSIRSMPSPLQVVQGGASGLNIVVIEPRSFEDSLEIVNHLKERKSVIVNLQYLDREVSQRVIDFVSGATLALDGSQERVGHGVFIFASMNCNVETESEGIKAYKDLFAKTFG